MPVLEYKSFLVRLWREKEDPSMRVDWMAEVEHVQSGQRWEFSSLDELLEFMGKQQIEAKEQNKAPKISG